MSVKQLTSQDFMMVGNQRKGLHIRLPGFVFVMFKMPQCPGCKAIAPVMAQLATEDRRVSYAMVDISVHKDVVRMSRQTVTPIQAVPTLILYSEGRPVAKVKNKKDIASLRAFLTDAMSKESQRAPQQQPQPHQSYQPQGQGQSARSQPSGGKVYYPEGYRDIGGIECEGDQCMLIPEQIHPHNKPWETVLD